MAVKDWWHGLTINIGTTVIIIALSAALPPAGVLMKYGHDFIATAHAVPGWIILCDSAIGGVFITSVGINIRQWFMRRRATRRTLTIVAEGHPNALNWSMGERTAPVQAPLMMPCGDFHITNISSSPISVPRTVLIAKGTFWGFIPWRRREEGAFPREVINPHGLLSEGLIWMVDQGGV